VLGIGLGNIHRGKCSSGTHSRHTNWARQSWKRCYRVGDSTIGRTWKSLKRDFRIVNSACNFCFTYQECLEKDCGIASSVSSAQHGNVPTNLEIVRAKVDKIQAELTSLSDQHGGFAANLESAKQDISHKTSQVRQEDYVWPIRL